MNATARDDRSRATDAVAQAIVDAAQAAKRRRASVLPPLDAAIADGPEIDVADHATWRGTHDRTLLQLAAAHGLPRTVAACIRAGADPEALDGNGRDAWDIAALHGHDAALVAMYDAAAPVHGPPIPAAILGPSKASAKRVIAVCLAHGGGIDHHDHRGMTGLVQAAKAHDPALAAHLLRLGADPATREIVGGSSALVAAAYPGGAETMVAILAAQRGWTGAWDVFQDEHEALGSCLWDAATRLGSIRAAWLHVACCPEREQPELPGPPSSADRTWLMELVTAAKTPPLRLLAMLGASS